MMLGDEPQSPSISTANITILARYLAIDETDNLALHLLWHCHENVFLLSTMKIMRSPALSALRHQKEMQRVKQCKRSGHLKPAIDMLLHNLAQQKPSHLRSISLDYISSEMPDRSTQNDSAR